MNKSELITTLSESTDLKKSEVERVIDAFLETVTKTLAQGDTLVLPGFGTFLSKAREARMGRNPATGEPIPIAAANVPKFKAGKTLKERVNAVD